MALATQEDLLAAIAYLAFEAQASQLSSDRLPYFHQFPRKGHPLGQANL